jgi:pantoate--beta-alanine ligase
MQVIQTITALRAQVKAWRQQNLSVALVPTMGNLHDGHLSLVKRAQTSVDRVIVSVFVNPMQFDDSSDLDAYPRTQAEDIQKLIALDCDVAFTPSVDVMYPQGMEHHSVVSVSGVDDKLCGKHRPGHFDGVATVVSKLLNIAQADIAVFGEKDYQQLMLIKKLAADLNIATTIVGHETQREVDGLAMSSRNQHLTQSERVKASHLYKTLCSIGEQLKVSDHIDFEKLETTAMAELEQYGFQPEYVEIRNALDLSLATSDDKALRVFVAARLGKARLIDNIACNLA